jgi:hypothetical protein
MRALEIKQAADSLGECFAYFLQEGEAMAGRVRMMIVVLVLMVMVPFSFSCGSDDADVNPDDSGGSGGIANPVKAVDKAQEAADDAERRAKEIEDEMNKQFEDIP